MKKLVGVETDIMTGVPCNCRHSHPDERSYYMRKKYPSTGHGHGAYFGYNTVEYSHPHTKKHCGQTQHPGKK